MIPQYTKDPDATLDYVINWGTWLTTGETITTYTVTTDPGITLASTSRAGALITMWLTGGTNRAAYTITCHITTSTGRQDDRSITINVANR